MQTFLLPDLGEGLEDVEIVSWHVNEGDHVVADQPLVSVETDKAIVEVPSPSSGRIARLFGAKGDVVKVGAPLVEFAADAGVDAGAIVGQLERASPQVDETAEPPRRYAHTGRGAAFPAVRDLAHKLDVDLTGIKGSGLDGTVTRADVERAAKRLQDAGPAEPLRGLRRAMAQRMTAAHAQVVPATVTEQADIGDWDAEEDPTGRLVRAIATAVRAEPGLNAWFDSEVAERRLVKRIDLGIAVDIEGGLVVPVLRNISERDANDLRAGLDRMRADVIGRKVPPEELRGATITLSNFGMIAGLYASLVVVPPQVAILGAGRILSAVVVRDAKPEVRRVLPLSLTFDHRVITGGEAARFLRSLKLDLERPT